MSAFALPLSAAATDKTHEYCRTALSTDSAAFFSAAVHFAVAAARGLALSAAAAVSLAAAFAAAVMPDAAFAALRHAEELFLIIVVSLQ